MRNPVPSPQRDKLFELYSELHLAYGRAAAALRLAERWDAQNEVLARFQREKIALKLSGSGSCTCATMRI